MKNNDKEFLNELKEEFSKQPVELPEALSADSISKLVKDEKFSKRSHKKALKITAAAASFAVVFVAAAMVFFNYSPPVKTITPSDKNTTSTVYTSDYTEIQSFFKSLRSNYKYDENRNIFDGFYSGIKKEYSSEMASADSIPSASVNGTNEDLETASGISASYNITDTQVDGVLEADIIKNDGRYLYIVHRENTNKIIIVDTKDPNALKIAAKIDLPKTDDETTYANEIFIKDKKLIVLTSTSPDRESVIFSSFNDRAVCCVCGSKGNKSGVIVYDLSKITEPKRISSYSVDGAYTTSRLIGDELVLVTNYIVPLYNEDEKLEAACIPSYFVNGEEIKIPANDIEVIKNNSENSYTVILKVNVSDKNAKPQASAILGGTSEVYCNKTDIYLARQSWEDDPEDKNNDGLFSYTSIYRFSLENNVKYQSSVKIPGSVLNQFSMDEYAGFFRIATSSNGKNYITVLDKSLKQISQLDNIAPDESIYAVRFMGNTAYVVTFYQTDPLFVIDLSNPTEPKVVGELKIPGFSNMLFPYSENLLIGIGEDGNEMGANGRIKISLFDISDKQNPKEISKATTETDSYTIAQYDHKAYMKFSDTGEFAIPVYDYSNPDKETSYVCAFKIENGELSAYKKYVVLGDRYNTLCRSAYTGNTVFALCANELYAFDRETTQELCALSLLDMHDENEGYVIID